MSKHILSQSDLKSSLTYNELTGDFYRQRKGGGECIAGGLNTAGYITIHLKGIRHYAHRLAWLYVYGEFPTEHIDHVNHIRHDNRIVNLRPANYAVNSKNRPIRSDNKSGVTGVFWEKSRNVWRVSAENGVYIGQFSSLLDAVCKRKSIERQHSYHKNNGIERTIKEYVKPSGNNLVDCITYDRKDNFWIAKININNTRIYLGCYKDWFEAVCARKSAENYFNKKEQ